MNYYQQNLAVLKSTRPELAAMVEAVRFNPNRYRLIPTKSALPSLEYTGEDGAVVLWYSRYDPLREVQRDLSAIDHTRIYMPLLSGIGLGYGLRALWNNYRNEFFDAVLLEPDPVMFRLALEVTKLDDILADPRLHIHVGTDLPSWMELVRKLIPSIMSCPLQYIPHAASQRCHTSFFQSALAVLHQKIQLTEAEFFLLCRSGSRIQENMWNNLPSIVSSIRLSGIRGILQGRPAIVIAAGPSLDKNVHHLAGVDNRFALIAVDTAYRTLKRHGIEPHVVVTTDPTELNAKHFEGVIPNPRTILAFDPEVFCEIPNAWPYRKLFLNLEKAAFTRWIENEIGPFGFLPKGSSVGHTAFYLALELGADPIVFMGLDLAFDPQGGTTHTADSALHRSYAAIPKGVNSANLGPRFGDGSMQESIVWVPGVCGNPVPTSKVMSLYINQFAEEFTRTSVRRIDATEGGALLPGTEIIPIKEVIQSLAARDGVNVLFTSLTAPPPQLLNIRTALDTIEQVLRDAEILARKGLDLSMSLASRMGESETVRNLPEWREMESTFSSIYQSEEIKIALEQSLFSAVYAFIQKERIDQVDVRRAKYENYFRAVLATLPHFQETIRHCKVRIGDI